LPSELPCSGPFQRDSPSLYNAAAKDKLGALVMVIKGARETIVKLKLPYEIKDKANCSWGLFSITTKNGKGK